MAKAKIRNSPGGGAKLDTFYFDAQQVVGEEPDGEDGVRSRVLQKKVSFDLYMSKAFVTTTDLPPPAATRDAGFRLFCEETKDEVFGSDISVMLKAMRAKLDIRYAIVWKPWFLVRIQPSFQRGEIGSGLTLSWEQIERGEAYDGSVLMRKFDPWADVHSSKYKVSTWPENFVEKSKMIAAIEGTDENEAMLRNAAKQVDELRARLVELLGPELIMQTLKALAGGSGLLGGPALPESEG